MNAASIALALLLTQSGPENPRTTSPAAADRNGQNGQSASNAGLNDPLIPVEISSLDGASGRITYLKIGVPPTWRRWATYNRWDQPFGAAGFYIDVFPMQNATTPEDCMQRIASAISEQGWEVMSVDGIPAMRRVSSDYEPSTKDLMYNLTFIGCNGEQKWVLTFTSSSTLVRALVPYADRVARSIRYVKSEARGKGK